MSSVTAAAIHAEVLTRDAMQTSRGSFRFRCPIQGHKDVHPSARWDPIKAIWYCYVCKHGGSWEKLGWLLGIEGLRPGSNTVYEVKNRAGRVEARHVRNGTGKDKRVWWEGGLNGRPPDTLPLYGSETLAQLEPGSTVIACEGEAAAHALQVRGIPAVGTVCGASSIPTSEVLGVLDGFDVSLWPDNDEIGRAHMDGIAAVLASRGTPARFIEWAEAPPSGDAGDFSGSDEALDALIEAAAPRTIPAQPTALINWADFWMADTSAEDWLLEPVLPRGRAIALFSPAKAGKSLLALEMAAKLATGTSVLDQPAGRPVNVVYLDMEMTQDDLRERLEDMGFGRGSDLSRLFYYSLPTLPPLDTPEGGVALRLIAQRHEAELVVIDTASRVLSGKENDSDTLRAFYMNTGLLLKADGRTVLRLDHAGKDLDRGQRGTSAKNDDVDLVWELTSQNQAVTLRATHRRQSWIPEDVPLLRTNNPLRHQRTAGNWPAGASDLAAVLDMLEIPREWGNRKVRQALKDADHPARNALIAAAINWRKRFPEPAGNVDDDDAGNVAGKRTEFRFGETHGETSGNVPPASGEQGVSPVGETLFPRPGFRSTCPDDPDHHVWRATDGDGLVKGRI